MSSTIESPETIAAAAQLHPPGTVAVACGDVARYHEFTFCLTHLQTPPGSKLAMNRGLSVVKNFNMAAREIEGEWLWIMGDDHTFERDLLTRLLDRNVDVVVPLVFRRTPPFSLLLFTGQQPTGTYDVMAPKDLPTEGLIEVYAAGSGGMLVRKHVLDAIGDPWFTTEGEDQNEDLVFCRKIREAGFKIHADVEAYLGHIGRFEIWPERRERWGFKIDFGESNDGEPNQIFYGEKT